MKKNKNLEQLNGYHHQIHSLMGGIAIFGKRGYQAHKNEYEMNFENSSFKPMFMKGGHHQ
jgi:hypothetical protein